MPRTLTVPPNVKGRDFVVGDIHGMFDTLDIALARIGFDPGKDRLFCVGDLIDRGPQSPRCIEFLQKPWFFATRGNHEALFLHMVKDGNLDRELCKRYVPHGTGWLLRQTRAQLRAYEAAFRQMPLAIEIPAAGGNIGIVHAEVPKGMGWAEFRARLDAGDRTVIGTALWGRDRVDAQDKSGVPGIGRLFSGHTPQAYGPAKLGNCIYIDTGGIFRGPGREDCYSLTVADANAPDAAFTAALTPDADGICIRLNAPPRAAPPAVKPQAPRL
jgi:serine/threonine protein phosphatase 1